MNKYLHLLVILFLCLVALAMSSVGIQFYNKCKSLHDDNTMKNDRDFLIVTLIASMIVGGVFIYRTVFTSTNNNV